MTNTVRGAVATRQESVGAFDPTDQKVLSYLNLNPADPKARAAVAVAKEYDLDPLLRHVIVIPKGGVYITRDGYLHVAHRSGQLDGIVVEQEPTLAEDGKYWTARVTVYRKDMRHGFTYPGRYPVGGQNAQYAPEMALKAAESHALRRAFNVSGVGSAEERFVDEADVHDADFSSPVGSDEADDAQWTETAEPQQAELVDKDKQ